MEFEPGADLGPYRLIRRLGAGGMGEVWEAEDPRLGRTVAIKILPPSVAENNESKARLTREARTAAQLYHPNIATIHSIEQANDRSFIVMEFVTGETLGDIIRRGPIEESRVCAMGRKVAEALAEAHEHGIIHRDIKPDNIVVSGDRVKVLDFGIAKQIGLEGISSSDPTAFVTQAGMIVGTVHYMSPEQALGKPLDARSDIFSLGVVLYQALTGKLPFDGETVTETITRIIRDEPEPIRAINPRVSDSMASIITACLDKNREKRFATARDLEAALDQQSTVAPTRPYTAPGAAVAGIQFALPASRPARPESFAPTVLDAKSAAPTLLVAKQPAPPKRSKLARWGVPLLVVLAAVGAAAWYLRDRGATPLPAMKTPAQAGPVTDSAINATAAEISNSTEVSQVDVAAPRILPSATPEPKTTHVRPPTVSSQGGPAGTVAEVTVQRPALPGPAGTSTTMTSTVPATPPTASADQEYGEGLRLMQNGDGEGAFLHFMSTLAIDPHYAPARLKVAQIELRRHRMMIAATTFREALREGDRLDAHDRLLAETGLAVTERKLERAEQMMEEFRTTYPGDPQIAMMESAVEWERNNGMDQQRVGRRRRGL